MNKECEHEIVLLAIVVLKNECDLVDVGRRRVERMFCGWEEDEETGSRKGDGRPAD